ncbi:hypothetical protein [Arthrobacter sp. H5]|uniref:hypothetical protein n=1 Tax=Arthrobacter sp. H5 TaxID=1267973 RepID=UPI0004873D0F|nr:hypothetical protein [Arthrobacter sp. H5]
MRPLVESWEQSPGERTLTKNPEQRLADLESARSQLVRTVLTARAACERATSVAAPAFHRSDDAQLLLCAAVRDLEDLDNQLDLARRPHP